MKKAAILLSLLLVFTFSCDKEYRFYAFYIETTVDVEFEAGSVGDFEIIQNVNIAVDNIFDIHETKADLVEEITIEALSLSATLFSDLNELNVFISAEGIEETTLATSDITTNKLDVTSLNVSDELLDDYVKSASFDIKAVGQLSSSHSQAFTIPLNLRFLVKTYVK